MGLARDPADVTTSGLIPIEGSPIVNVLMARSTTEDRPTWATANSERHAASVRSDVCRMGLTIQWNASAMNRQEPDCSGEVSGKPSM